MRRTSKRIVDLSAQKATVDYVDASAFYCNDEAHDWVVRTYNNNIPVTLEGSVSVYVQLPSGDWVGGMTGTIAENSVTATFVQDCYLQVGKILCMMVYTQGDTRLVLDAFYTRIQPGYGGEDPITPSDKVILWSDVEAKLEEMDDMIEAMEAVMPPSFPSEAGIYVLQVHVESGQTPQSEWLPNEGIIAEDDGNGNVTIRYST